MVWTICDLLWILCAFVLRFMAQSTQFGVMSSAVKCGQFTLQVRSSGVSLPYKTYWAGVVL